MKNLISKIKSKLKPVLLAGAIALGSLVNANAQENPINPFVRPNINSLNYYGSGDVNNDNLVNQTDLDLIQTENYTNPDWADVNGDEVVDNKDVSLLESYLNKEIPYLPGDWDKLQTKPERKDWTNKMIRIDKTNKIPYKDSSDVSQQWVCYQYSTQTHLNFYGYSGNDIPAKFDTLKDGRFNLPVYYVHIDIENSNTNHTINSILIGDNPLDFNDWYFFEPQQDIEVIPGEWNMPKNSEITLVGIRKFLTNSDGIPIDYFRGIYPISFKLNDITPQLVEDSVNPNLILERPSIEPSVVAEDKPKQFILKQNYPNPFNANTTIEYSLNEPGKTTLDVFNISGQKLETLVNDYQQSGKHSVNWNANNYSSGTYLYQLRKGNEVEKKKMMLVK